MKSFVQISILFAVVVALVGQSFAFESISCAMSTEANTSPSINMSNHADMDHYAMGHQTIDEQISAQSLDLENQQSANSTSEHDCCGTECQCPQSACTAFSYVANQQRLQFNGLVSEKILGAIFTLIHTDINSLFRPPILA